MSGPMHVVCHGFFVFALTSYLNSLQEYGCFRRAIFSLGLFIDF